MATTILGYIGFRVQKGKPWTLQPELHHIPMPFLQLLACKAQGPQRAVLRALAVLGFGGCGFEVSF